MIEIAFVLIYNQTCMTSNTSYINRRKWLTIMEGRRSSFLGSRTIWNHLEFADQYFYSDYSGPPRATFGVVQEEIPDHPVCTSCHLLGF